MATVPWEEKIVTIETERELYLNKGPRHSQVQDLQYSPAMFAGSDVTASYSLADAFYESLRSSAQRILFGEMRGPESGWAMKAMQAGRGSVSTIHARSADDAIHRFADMLMSEYGLATDTVPLRQILRSIDIIIYLDFIENPDGTRTRIVSEVAEVVPNDRGEPMASKLFQWDWDHDTYVEPEKPSNLKLLPMLARASRVNGIPWEF
jgi:type IV secretory pathway ATPase VirB11/archaellum biosynthesis ATPase